VRVTGLVGVYSNPDVVVVYPDGNRVQIVGVVFHAGLRWSGEHFLPIWVGRTPQTLCRP
jgi:hypothetical protein